MMMIHCCYCCSFDYPLLPIVIAQFVVNYIELRYTVVVGVDCSILLRYLLLLYCDVFTLLLIH